MKEALNNFSEYLKVKKESLEKREEELRNELDMIIDELNTVDEAAMAVISLKERKEL
jgi:prefoldin subunit 5